MLYIYNETDQMGVQYKESNGKGTLNLVVKGEKLMIGSAKEPEIKNSLLQRASDKRQITSRLKRIFLCVKGKRLVLDTDTHEFKYIEEGTKFNFVQNIVYLVCNGKVEVKTSNKDFLKAPEYTYNKDKDFTVVTLLPKWRAWYTMKSEVIIDLYREGKKVNCFELSYITNDEGVKSNSLKYRQLKDVKKEVNNKPATKYRKPFAKPITSNEDVKEFDKSKSKYPASKKKTGPKKEFNKPQQNRK